MIRYKLREQITAWEYRNRRRLPLKELADATGIYRTTLSRLTGPSPINTTTRNIARLCEFFGCTVADLVEYVPDDAQKTSAQGKPVPEGRAGKREKGGVGRGTENPEA